MAPGRPSSLAEGGGAAGAYGGGRRGAADKSNVPPLCAGCHKHLTAADLQPMPPSPQQRRHQHQQQQQREAGAPLPGAPPGGPPLLECAACHRCFHARCHSKWVEQQSKQQQQQRRGHWWQRPPREGGGAGRREATAGAAEEEGRAEGRQREGATGANGREGGGDVAGELWFHSAECSQVHRALQRLCRAGDIPISSDRPAGRSPGGGAAAAVAAATSAASGGGGGFNATSPDHDVEGQLAVRLYDCRNLGLATAAGLRRVHSVLRQEFGYSLSDLRLFDYAALLTRGPLPVSAAIVDLYGTDAAELYLVATRSALQRKGYGTALVRQLGEELGGAGVRRLLVSVDDDDEANQGLWRDKFGFERMLDSELSELGRTFGAFSAAAADGTVFLARRLCGPAGRSTQA
ncbi:Apoptosis inhibitor 5 [Pleodorina starrii]|nr:Apoptosis inhibitor 5 [Pleodorina starrii]